MRTHRRFETLVLTLGLTLLGVGLLTPSAGALAMFDYHQDYATGREPQRLAVTDFDGDGNLDVAAVCRLDDKIVIHYGTGTGRLSGSTEVVTGDEPRALALTDADSEGHPDIAVAQWTNGSASILTYSGPGSYYLRSYLTGMHCSSIIAGDFNGDGKADLATANSSAAQVTILVGDGMGGFARRTIETPYATTDLAAADFDNDGSEDLVVVSGSVAYPLKGDGAGSFTVGTAVYLPEGDSCRVAAGDFNDDGNQDFVAAGGGHKNVLVRLGDGSGGFVLPVVAGAPTGAFPATSVAGSAKTQDLVTGDFNGDGFLDVAVANFRVEFGAAGILLGDGTGRLTVQTGEFWVEGARGIAAGDLNEDGKLDLVVGNALAQHISVLLGRYQLPTGTMTVNAGAAVTGNRSVRVKANVAEAAEMRLRDAGGAWTQWMPAGTLSDWTLPAGDGVKTVEAQYRNPLGSTGTLSDTILLDTTAPATSDDAGDAWRTVSGVTVTLTADDGAGSGVEKTQYKLDDAAWSTGTSVAVSGDGVHTIQYRSEDKAGNREDAGISFVRLDGTSPVTICRGADGMWHNSAVELSFVGSDRTSGIAKTEYGVGFGLLYYEAEGTWVTIDREGVTYVAAWSTDVAGNVGSAATTTVRIDKTAPVTVDDAPSGWQTTSPVRVTLTPTDALSGVAGTEYRLDGASAWSAGATVDVAGDGVHSLLYRSRDNAANIEDATARTVRIDATAPRTTARGADDAWHRDPVTISLSATDAASGVASTEYTTDGGDTWTSGAVAVVAREGLTTVGYRSTDVAGNVEDMGTVDVKIDRTAPATSDDAPAGWLTGSPATVHLTPTDAGGSGVAATQYKLDAAAAWTTGASVEISGDGAHTLRYRSVDAAGNVGETAFTTVRVDSTAPEVAITGLDDAWHDGPVFAQVLATDLGSGVAFTTYRVDGGAWMLGTGVLVSREGEHTVACKAADVAGNEAAERTARVRIDRTAPTTTAVAPAAWTKAAVTIELAASDELSGMSGGAARTEYSLDGGATWSHGGSVTVQPDAAEQSTDARTVLYRSVDNAGNVETDRSCVARVDTCPPVTFARPASVKKGRPVRFRVMVSDAIPGSPKATVVIAIRSRTGRLLRTLRPVTVPTNAAAGVTWAKCRLKAGTYTYEVRATDAAGNAQSRGGMARLVVK